MGERPVRIVCAWCESDRVSRDAWADWDAERQAWVLGAVFDDGFCHQCGCVRRLAEVRLSGNVAA